MNPLRANLAELQAQWVLRERARDMIAAGLAAELAAEHRIAELLDEQVDMLADEREAAVQ